MMVSGAGAPAGADADSDGPEPHAAVNNAALATPVQELTQQVRTQPVAMDETGCGPAGTAMIGDTMFALRLMEARCIEVLPS